MQSKGIEITKRERPASKYIEFIFVLIEERIPALILVVMTLLIGYGVFSRHVLHQPVAIMNELALTLSLWVVFLGAAAATRLRLHVGLDTLVSRFPPRRRAFIDIFAYAIISVMMCILTWLSFRLLQGTLAELYVLQISKKWMLASMPIGMLLTTIHVITGMFEAIKGARTGEYFVVDQVQAEADYAIEAASEVDASMFELDDPTERR